MTDTSGREKVLEEALRKIVTAWEASPRLIDTFYETELSGCIRVGQTILASPSTQEPALRGGKVEEIARRAAEEIDIKAHTSGGLYFCDLAKDIIAAALRTYASESGMAKDMQEIMRINNELNEALTAERQRRGSAENALRDVIEGNYSGVAARAHFSRYAHAGDLSEEGKGG